MDATKKTGRLAGLMYLVFIGCGFFYLRYVPSAISIHGNSSALVGNIRNNDALFRMGILVEVISNLIFLALALAFYKLFSAASKVQALVMVIFVAIGVMISFIGIQNKFAVLTLINDANINSTITADQLKTQVSLYFDFYRNGIVLAEIFWGLWLLPLGILVLKSAFLPKFIGILLIIGCFGYVADFTGSFFFPRYNDWAFSNYVTMPASLGELSICLWLLFAGVKKKQAYAVTDNTPG